MKFLKKITVALCVTAIAASMGALVACNNDNDSDDKKPDGTTAAITDGYFTAQVAGMKVFYHFSEDGTYYGSAYDGGKNDAGTYVLADGGIEYYADLKDWSQMGAVDDNYVESSKTTSSQKLTLTSYLGGEPQVIAYETGKMCDFLLMGQSKNVTLTQDATYNYIAADEETPIAIATYYYENNSMNTLTLYHDKTYKDYTGLNGGNGTWVKTSTGYTLTNSSDAERTLTVSGDSVSYKIGNDTHELTTTTSEAVAVFEAEEISIAGIAGMEEAQNCPVKLNVYGTGSCELVMSFAGNDVVVDTGTCVIDDSGMFPSYTFTFEHVTVTAEPDYSTATLTSITIKATVTANEAPCVFGTVDMNLTFTGVLSFTWTKEVTEVGQFTATNATVTGIPGMETATAETVTLVLKSDNTCELRVAISAVAPMLGADYIVLDIGTYTSTANEQTGAPVHTFTFVNAGEITAELDWGSASASGINTTLAYTVTDASVDGAPIPLSLSMTQSLVFHYSIA